jgi:hypothetical protein
MRDSDLGTILMRNEIPFWLAARAGATALGSYEKLPGGTSVTSHERRLARALAEYLSDAPALPMPMDDVSFFYRMEADQGGSE